MSSVTFFTWTFLTFRSPGNLQTIEELLCRAGTVSSRHLLAAGGSLQGGIDVVGHAAHLDAVCQQAHVDHSVGRGLNVGPGEFDALLELHADPAFSPAFSRNLLFGRPTNCRCHPEAARNRSMSTHNSLSAGLLRLLPAKKTAPSKPDASDELPFNKGRLSQLPVNCRVGLPSILPVTPPSKRGNKSAAPSSDGVTFQRRARLSPGLAGVFIPVPRFRMLDCSHRDRL